RVLELDGAGARNLARDPGEKRRLHRESGDWRVILDDNLDVDGVGQRLEMPHDSLGVQLRHARRTDHHCCRADLMRMAAVGYAGPSSLGSGSSHDTDAALHMLNHNLEHSPALTIVEPRDLTRDAERCHTVDAGTYE